MQVCWFSCQSSARPAIAYTPASLTAAGLSLPSCSAAMANRSFNDFSSLFCERPVQLPTLFCERPVQLPTLFCERPVQVLTLFLKRFLRILAGRAAAEKLRNHRGDHGKDADAGRDDRGGNLRVRQRNADAGRDGRHSGLGSHKRNLLQITAPCRRGERRTRRGIPTQGPARPPQWRRVRRHPIHMTASSSSARLTPTCFQAWKVKVPRTDPFRSGMSSHSKATSCSKDAEPGDLNKLDAPRPTELVAHKIGDLAQLAGAAICVLCFRARRCWSEQEH